MTSKVQAKKPTATTKVAQPIKAVHVQSLEARLADVTDRSEMLAARVAALELALRKMLEHWPQGRGKLRKQMDLRSKRVGKSLGKRVPAIDEPTWQKAIGDLLKAID